MFRFMLAHGQSVKLESVRFPVVASPKIDGLRAGQISQKMLSRTLKPFPNEMLQLVFPHLSREGWDGELVSGPPTAPDVFHRTQSQVMSRGGGTASLTWWVFDNFAGPHKPFAERYLSLPEFAEGPNIQRLPHTPIATLQQLIDYEEAVVSQGYEGVMLRDPMAYYKSGRSTLNEGYLLKLKRFLDEEWIVTGFIELEKNINELTRDERGYAKRSSRQSGKVLMNTLGAMEVDRNGQHFKVGIFKGFSKARLQEIWYNREDYVGRRGKFQFLPPTKDAPRSARFIGWRDETE